MNELEFFFEGPEKMKTLRYSLKIVELVLKELEDNPRVTVNFYVQSNEQREGYRGYARRQDLQAKR